MRESIGRRLLFIFTSLAVVPLLLAGVIMGAQNLVVQQRQALALQQQIAKGVSQQVRGIYREVENSLRLASQVVELMDLSRDQQRDFLWNILLGQSDVVALSLVDGDGMERVRVSSLGVAGPGDLRDMSQTAEFRVPKMRNEVYYSPLWFEELFNEPVMTIGLPILDVYSDDVVGVLVATVRFRPVWDMLAALPVFDDEQIFIVDADGMVVAHRDPSVVFHGARFSVPARDGVQPGLNGEMSIMAVQQFKLGDQTLYTVAARSVASAMAIGLRWELFGLVIVIIVGAVAVFIGNHQARSIVTPIEQMAAMAQAAREGDLSVQVEVESEDEIGVLAELLNSMTAQLRELVGTLEERVEERTRSLQAAAEVARATTSVLDPDELMRQVVDLVRERFDLYYVGLFLVDEERRYAVLRAGTGEAGRRMLEQGHRLEVGGNSMIGQCIALAEARVAMDVSEEDKHFDNPLLPETHSELALPLRSRGRVIGAMTVQSTALAAFDEATIAVLQTMADLVAVAIDNARLFVASQETLREMESIQRRYLGQAWAEYAQESDISGYRNVSGEVVPLAGEVLPEVKQVLAEQRALTLSPEDGAEETASELVVPVKLRDLVIGAVGFKRERHWSAEDVVLAESLAEQLALAADNLRLLDETQRNAARERLTREITARMRETLDVDYVLRTAVRGIREALGLLEAEAWLESSINKEERGGQ